MAYIILKQTYYANISLHFPMRCLLYLIRLLTVCFTISVTVTFMEHLIRTNLLKKAYH